jgi:cytochrome c peroxidase
VPTIVNRVWGTAFFWDGRARTLEEQALQPVLNPQELGMTREGILAVVRSPEYARDFRAAFGSGATLDLVGRAITSYVRTIMSGDSPYDRGALNGAAQRGMKLFFGKAGCSTCHAGPNFTDEQFHNTGVAWRTGSPADIGRAAVTGAVDDRGAFKTPTLRDVARTAPYMHDGSCATLAEVVEYYDRGGQKNPGLDVRIRPLHLAAQEKAEIVAFLESLTGNIATGR